MEEIRTQGTSVLVVSHNLNSVRLLCKRTMVLHNGEVKFLGETDKAISLYHDLLAVPLEEPAGEDADGAVRDASVRLTSFTLVGPDGQATNHVKFGDEMTFVLEAEFLAPVNRPAFSFVLANERQQIIYSDYAHQQEHQRSFRAGERARFLVTVRATLPTGSYKARSGARWGLGTK
ncbi:MAG: Wzt carbohydrate-binding domain-containing protein, partial [Actinomycetota bacterium]